jgi:hypothetical protein
LDAVGISTYTLQVKTKEASYMYVLYYGICSDAGPRRAETATLEVVMADRTGVCLHGAR